MMLDKIQVSGGLVGWCDGVGKTSIAGAFYLDNTQARVYCACSGCGCGCLDIFFSSIISFLSPSLWETVRYRLKYCLVEPLSPK